MLINNLIFIYRKSVFSLQLQRYATCACRAALHLLAPFQRHATGAFKHFDDIGSAVCICGSRNFELWRQQHTVLHACAAAERATVLNAVAAAFIFSVSISYSACLLRFLYSRLLVSRFFFPLPFLCSVS